MLTTAKFRSSDRLFGAEAEYRHARSQRGATNNASLVACPFCYVLSLAKGGQAGTIDSGQTERMFGANTSQHALTKRLIAHLASWVFNPFRNCFSLAMRRYESASAAVSRLLCSRGPFAITRRVCPIVVFALYCQSALVSVSKGPRFEFREIQSPLTADVNPAPSVIHKPLALCPVATVEHTAINLIQGIARSGIWAYQFAALEKMTAFIGATFSIVTALSLIAFKLHSALKTSENWALSPLSNSKASATAIFSAKEFTSSAIRMIRYRVAAYGAWTILHMSPPVRDLRLLRGEVKTGVVDVSERVAKTVPIPQPFYYGVAA